MGASTIKENHSNKAILMAPLASSVSELTNKSATPTKTAKTEIQGQPKPNLLAEKEIQAKTKTIPPAESLKPKDSLALNDKDEPKNTLATDVSKPVLKTTIDVSSKLTKIPEDIKPKQEEKQDLGKTITSINTEMNKPLNQAPAEEIKGGEGKFQIPLQAPI